MNTGHQPNLYGTIQYSKIQIAIQFKLQSKTKQHKLQCNTISTNRDAIHHNYFD